jgi:hypothetical protein
MRSTLGALVGSVIAAALVAAPVGASVLTAHMLSVTNMPVGWSATPKPSSGLMSVPCLSAFSRAPRDEVAKAQFSPGAVPVVFEELATDEAGRRRWSLLGAKLAKCQTFTYSHGAKADKGTVGAISLPTVGTASKAFAMTLSLTGVTADIDLVLFHAKPFYGLVGYGDVGAQNITAVEAFANEAAAKAKGQPVTPPTT